MACRGDRHESGGGGPLIHSGGHRGSPVGFGRQTFNRDQGRDGDRSNAVLAAAGHNFSLLLRWLAGLLRDLIRALFSPLLAVQTA